MKRIALGVLGSFALLGLVACETKEMAKTPASIVAERQQAMKGLGGNWGKINEFAENKQGNSYDVIAAALSTVEVAARIPGMFPEGTSADDMPGVSYAKPDIWADWSQFEAAAKTLEDEANKLAEIARTGNNPAIKAQFEAFGGACGGCHKPFRIKKDG
jgi:cytochrome c556